MDEERFTSLKQYVGFDDTTSALLREVHPHVASRVSAIMDDFYATIEAHPRASAVISGGKEQIERLKRSLRTWLGTVLTGPHNLAYVQSHARIGRVHVRIGLPQEFMFTAMNRIRLQLKDAIRKVHAFELDRRNQMLDAADKVLDLELAIMLDTYREDLNEKIRSAERLATIGQLAASIGHELRNPLGTIESSLFLVEQRLKRTSYEDPQVGKHLEKIAKQIKHCTKTITNLLDLARERPPKRQRILARTLLAQVLETAALPADVQVEIATPPELTLDADPEDLLHVIVNLFVNAAQAQNAGGRIVVSGESAPGGTELFVSDDGPGIPAEIRHRVFDALFTTKAHGTGLGLALCRRVIYAHGGELTLEPSERGARFRIWLPEQVFGADTGAAGASVGSDGHRG